MIKKPQAFFLDSFTASVCHELTKTIKKIIKEDIPLELIAKHLTMPPQETWGHWALPCFFLANKEKNRQPTQIAAKLAKTYQHASSIFQKVQANGPYLNVTFQVSFLCKELLVPIQSGKLFHTPAKKHGTYLVEYSQPNTHKELHVGHLRNVCFGMALTKLLKKRGFSVVSCTFPGDIGTHTAKCLWYLKYHNKESPPNETTAPFIKKGVWLGQVYSKACAKFDKASKDPSTSLNIQKQITNILKELQAKKGEFYQIWQETRQWSIDLMQHIYQWMGVHFDKWYWESEVDQASVKWVKKLYQNKKLSQSEQAIGKNLGEKLGFCLLLKSDGNGLYATKDLYLAKQKVEDYQPEKNIYIVDYRQERHFMQLFAVLSSIGYSDLAKQSIHLKYNFVQLPSGPMSSRVGNIVPILTVIQNMKNYVEKQFLQKYKNIHLRQKIATQIAEGAIKYGMNAQDLHKKIIFNMQEWLSWDGKSGPYIQYAYARSCSLLRKNPNAKFNQWNQITTLSPEESAIIIQLSRFSLVMENCAWQMKTAPICHYLFELAKKFSRFYQNCPISSLTEHNKKAFRLFLVQTVRAALREGLSYLGIPNPEQM